jgi:hypothetical protein
VLDARSRKIVGQLTDEKGTAVQSEKMMEIAFEGRRTVECGDQFGLGRNGE